MISSSAKKLSKVLGKREVIAENQPVPALRQSSEDVTGENQSPVLPKPRTMVGSVDDAPPTLPGPMGNIREETTPPPRRKGLLTATSVRLQPQQRPQVARPATVSSGGLAEGVLDALRCPTCGRHMVPPIFMCASGHSMCDACRAGCRGACPSCGGAVEATRNLALERLAEAAPPLLPCGHCGRRLPAALLRRHEAGCALRPLACPLACGWRGRRHLLLAHAQGAHPGHHSAVADAGVLRVHWGLPLKASFHDYRHAVFAFGEAFAYVKHFSQEKRRLYLAVQLLGDPASAPNYRYKFKMAKDSRGCHESTSRTRSVHACDEDLDTVLQSNACITVDFDTLVYFGNGPRTFKIFKVQQKDDSESKMIVF